MRPAKSPFVMCSIAEQSLPFVGQDIGEIHQRHRCDLVRLRSICRWPPSSSEWTASHPLPSASRPGRRQWITNRQRQIPTSSLPRSIPPAIALLCRENEEAL